MILKKFLKFPKSEPRDSYKLDSYKKKCVLVKTRLHRRSMEVTRSGLLVPEVGYFWKPE